MTFLNAMQTKDTFTENGMPTHSTSGSYLVDLFYRLGASRNDSEKQIIEYFTRAFYQKVGSLDIFDERDAMLNALRVAFYGRDVRSGQGERRFFRTIISWLTLYHPDIMIKNIPNVVEFGRWDDFFVIWEDNDWAFEVKKEVADFILSALKKGDKLCAKWMPREGKKNAHIAKYLREQWNLTPKNYRKLLAGNTEVVENLMCKNDWKNINYEHVPSVAMNKYKTAFYRHDEDGMTNYVDAVKKGEKKINSSVLYPSDIVCSLRYTASKSEQDLAQAQWDALPNFCKRR